MFCCSSIYLVVSVWCECIIVVWYDLEYYKCVFC